MTNELKNIFLLFLFITSGITSLVSTGAIASGDSTKLVYRFSIKEEILPGIARKVSKAIDEAEKLKADYLLIHMNTYGGMVDAADSIRTKILNCKIPSIVFVDNNAASAGALIAISCSKIYMRAGANIGAATVVNEKAEAMPDKYQSYMRSMMRSTAEARGRDPHIAEAMVDPRTYIPGVNDSGKVLTFTTSEAMKHGFCNGEAETLREVLRKENIIDYNEKVYDPTWVENLIGFLINPVVSGILILVMLGGIYFEMQHPGIGIPLFAGILAAILYFAPLYLEGLAANWEILAFFIGMILIALEIFVIPGFGITGISGIILVVVGLSAAMLNNNGLDFSGIGTDHILASLAIVVLSMLGSLVLFFTVGRSVMASTSFGKFVLKDSMQADAGYVSASAYTHLVGKTGVAVSPLRLSGKVNIDGEIFNATSDSGFIEINKSVKVIRTDGMQVWVRENS